MKLFQSDRDSSNLYFIPEPQNKHDPWLPLRSQVSAARSLGLRKGPHFWNSLPFPPQQIPDLQALRSYKERKKKHICFFLNWCRFPDGIRSHYWLRRNTCLWGPQIWQMVHFEYLKQINKAFSVFADTHYPVLLKLCQMQTPKANFSSFCSVPNLCKELHWWESLSFVLLCLWTYGPTVVYWWVKLHMAAR